MAKFIGRIFEDSYPKVEVPEVEVPDVEVAEGEVPEEVLETKKSSKAKKAKEE